MPEELSTRACRNLIKESTIKEVSDDAADSLGRFLESWSREIAEQALVQARRSGRKTVKPKDIRQVLKDKTDLEVKEHLKL